MADAASVGVQFHESNADSVRHKCRALNSHFLINEFDRFIRRDPAGRGLIASEPQYGPLCERQLIAAAEDLASHGRTAVIVTGFYVPDADVPCCESDGPLGSLMLAAVLERCGIASFVVTDSLCEGAMRAGSEFVGVSSNRIAIVAENPQEWFAEFITKHGEPSHLIAVERVGPSHTESSIRAQYRGDEAQILRFLAEVPIDCRDRCHNIRGEEIDDYTPPLHRLFCEFPRTTIGIGDGGNEIGMGSIPWHEIVQRLAGDHAAESPCRIATDFTILAGTSNWGAYALAAAVALLRDQVEVLVPYDCNQQEMMLQHIVEHGPSVDGITRRCEPTVDGLPFITYCQPWAGIRRLLDLPQ